MIKNKEEKQLLRDKQEAENRKKLSQLRADFSVIAELPEGRNVLKFLMGECGYQKPSITFNPETKDIAVQATIYLEALRGLYLNIRRYIPAKHLKKIEFK